MVCGACPARAGRIDTGDCSRPGCDRFRAALGKLLGAARRCRLRPCWGLSALWPRLTLTAAGCAFLLAMAVAPVLGIAAQNWLPSLILDRFAVMTGQARIDIWHSFGEVARARPIAGAGF